VTESPITEHERHAVKFGAGVGTMLGGVIAVCIDWRVAVVLGAVRAAVAAVMAVRHDQRRKAA
jgi:hypothetical protein